MEQLKYSSKMYVDNPQIKIKPCRMAATNSPTTAHLSPLPTEHRDKSTKTQTHAHSQRKLPTHCTRSNFSFKSMALQDSGRGHGLC